MGKKRTMLETQLDILSLCQEPQTRSSITSGANINSLAASKHLDDLVNAGCLERIYRITPKGKDVLEKGEKITEALFK